MNLKAFTNANVIDVLQAKIEQDVTILVENGKISAMGAGLPLPKAAEVFNLQHAYVCPGLFNVHVH